MKEIPALSDKAPTETVKWYHKPATVLLAILFAGVFALPLLWLNPHVKLRYKVILSLLVTAATVWLLKASVDIYIAMIEEMKELQEILAE